MKKVFIFLWFSFMLNQLMAQDITGMWQGEIPAGGRQLHLVFNIKKTGDTSYTSTFDSPDQKAFGIPCNKTTVLNDSVFIDLGKAGISYRGFWDEKKNINGTFIQGTAKVSLNLEVQLRPQTPKQPYGYYSEDVEYDNADKSLHYGATFTRPNGSEKYPAVIIITGSGTQDRDGTLFGHKLYWVLADYLTKNGIAVLRVDDRGAGKSTLGEKGKNATSLDFSYDVEASLNYLETRLDVDKKHLGLIGHSEGGMIAPMVAARRKDVSFIVMWGAPEVGGVKINAAQNAYALKQSGMDSLSVNAFIDLHSQILALFGSSENKEVLDQKMQLVFDNWKKMQSQQVLDNLKVHDNSIIGQTLFLMYNGLYDLPWMRFFLTYNPQVDLAKVKCSVLAINGEKDTQVNARENLDLIKKILTQNGNKDFEVKILPGLNHLLQTAQIGDFSEYGKIEETMSPIALNIIYKWIKLHAR
jgi:pimeloyl-ACP methyl ester carboxylesterase